LQQNETTAYEKIKKAIADWVKQYPSVELAAIDVHPGSVPDAFHEIVVASKGFENWRQMDRDKNLYWFLHKKFADFEHIDISILRTFTEEESEKYERVFYV